MLNTIRATRFLSLLLLISAVVSHAQLPNPQGHLNPHVSRLRQQPLQHLAVPRAAPKLAAANVIAVVYPPDAQALGAATCGNVYVPLHRSHRIPGTIPIYFELYTHIAHPDRL